jgi:hypothetical protein
LPKRSSVTVSSRRRDSSSRSCSPAAGEANEALVLCVRPSHEFGAVEFGADPSGRVSQIAQVAADQGRAVGGDLLLDGGVDHKDQEPSGKSSCQAAEASPFAFASRANRLAPHSGGRPLQARPGSVAVDQGALLAQDVQHELRVARCVVNRD